MNLAKWISKTEAFDCGFAPSKEEVLVKAAGVDKKRGHRRTEVVTLMNNCDTMSLYTWRDDAPPSSTSTTSAMSTSTTMLPKAMILSSPRRLYNRRGPTTPPNSESPPPPVLCNPRSVLKKTVSKEELQQPAYVKKTFTIDGDVLGWGFVVRGNSPCHIQTVEPRGPAAKAGMKVCQFVVSINNQNVLDMDYKSINRLILSGPKRICMEVMEERNV